MTPTKMKNNFCDEHQYEMRKSWDGGGNNANKIFMCQVEEGNIIYKQNILFGAVHSCNEKKKTIFSMKPKSQDRRAESVKRTKNARTSTGKKCLSTTKDQAPIY